MKSTRADYDPNYDNIQDTSNSKNWIYKIDLSLNNAPFYKAESQKQYITREAQKDDRWDIVLILQFKIRYLKILKLFSIIGVKELFEAIVLRRKNRQGFALFYKHFDLWETLGNCENCEGKSFTLRKIDCVKTKYGVWQIITMISVTHVQKDL